MKIKLNNFQEKWVEIDDAKFLVVEMDYNELATSSLITSTTEVKVDFVLFVNSFFNKSVKNWEGLTDNEGKEIPFNAENRSKIPFATKQIVFNKINEISKVTEEKKTI